MKLATSRITAQGQISIPAEVRRRLGLAPGSVIDWELDGDEVVVRRAGKYSSLDIHRAVFGEPPLEPAEPVTPEGLGTIDQAIADHLRAKHARR